jgi:hypothetical protein
MPLNNKNKPAQQSAESQLGVRDSGENIQNSGEADSYLLEKSSEEYIIEPLDTSVFEMPSTVTKKPIVKVSEVVTPDADTQSTKVSKLRKFKGHRKASTGEEEEDKFSAMSPEDSVDYFKERLKKGETKEQIAFSIAIKESSKDETKENSDTDRKTEQKAYSPNRSFIDLLNDSDRRKLQHARTNPEAIWNKVTGSKSDTDEGKGSNFKKFVLIGITVLAICSATVMFYEYLKESSNPPASEENVDKKFKANETLTTFTSQTDDKYEYPEDIKSELKSKITTLLYKFHESTDLAEKASVCLVPNRTLADMKKYYSDRENSYKVLDVQIGQVSHTKNNNKLIQAVVKLDENGTEDFKYGYFSEDDSGKIKLDWYSYVGFEPVSWNSYLSSKADSPMDWHLTINFNGDLHPDYEEKKFVALNVRSWAPNTVESTNAMLSKEDPMYDKLVDAYEAGQRTFILKVRHIGDIASSLVVDEIISLSEFHASDTDAD